MYVCGDMWRWVNTFDLNYVHGSMLFNFNWYWSLSFERYDSCENTKLEMQNAQSLISESIARIMYTVCVYLCLISLLLFCRHCCCCDSWHRLNLTESYKPQFNGIHSNSWLFYSHGIPLRMWVYKSDESINEFNTRISLGKYCAQIFAMMQLMQSFQSHTY